MKLLAAAAAIAAMAALNNTESSSTASVADKLAIAAAAVAAGHNVSAPDNNVPDVKSADQVLIFTEEQQLRQG